MRSCALSELKEGEVVLARYPNGEMGTCIIERIYGRILFLKSNWEEKAWNFNLVFEKDYCSDIKKIKCDWDAKVNI